MFCDIASIVTGGSTLIHIVPLHDLVKRDPAEAGNETGREAHFTD